MEGFVQSLPIKLQCASMKDRRPNDLVPQQGSMTTHVLSRVSLPTAKIFFREKRSLSKMNAKSLKLCETQPPIRNWSQADCSTLSDDKDPEGLLRPEGDVGLFCRCNLECLDLEKPGKWGGLRWAFRTVNISRPAVTTDATRFWILGSYSSFRICT